VACLATARSAKIKKRNLNLLFYLNVKSLS
jgi:hypothetical protein